MNKIIEQKLKEIEEKENVKIILAVESGSVLGDLLRQIAIMM